MLYILLQSRRALAEAAGNGSSHLPHTRTVSRHAGLFSSQKALEQARRALPKPFANVLAPQADLARAFDNAVELCKRDNTWEMDLGVDFSEV